MREKPGSLYWAIMTGTSPQCTPNMTKTCQQAPMTAPATQGTCSNSMFMSEAMPLDAIVVTGPTVMRVRGTMTSSTSSGTEKLRMAEGRSLDSQRWRWDWNHTATMIGTREDV